MVSRRDKSDRALDLSVVAVPKPFDGTTGIQQKNAIRSWARLPCETEIILMGGEQGVAEIAAEVGAIQVDGIERDEFETPLLSSVYEEIGRHARGRAICYVNADIILLPDLIEALALAQHEFERFLLVARRWNIELERELSFESGWDAKLRRFVHDEGELLAPKWIDIFVFSPALYPQMPEFAIGRCYWDNWLIFEARRLGVSTIDATEGTTIAHQNHGYAGGVTIADIRQSPQGKRNFYLAGDGHYRLGQTSDATHLIADGQLRKTQTKTVSVNLPHHDNSGRVKNYRSEVQSAELFTLLRQSITREHKNKDA